jgi:hypothetical protein
VRILLLFQSADGSINHTAASLSPFAVEWISSLEFIILDRIQIVLPPIVLFVGTLGSLVVHSLLRRGAFRSVSACRYAAAIVAFGLIRLYIDGLTEWVTYLTGTRHPVHRSDTLCRVWQFLAGCIRALHGWSVVGLAVDRVVYWRARPSYVTSVCTPFVAGAALIGASIVVVVVAVHSMWVYELVDEQCAVSPSRRDFEAVVWPWVMAVVLSVLPLIGSMIAIPPLILYTHSVRRTTRQSQQLRLSNECASGDGLITTAAVALEDGAARSDAADVTSLIADLHRPMTHAAAGTSCFYSICVLPTVALEAALYFWPPDQTDNRQFAIYYDVMTICSMLSVIHSGLMFVVIFAAVGQLRTQLVTLVTEWCRRAAACLGTCNVFSRCCCLRCECQCRTDIGFSSSGVDLRCGSSSKSAPPPQAAMPLSVTHV